MTKILSHGGLKFGTDRCILGAPITDERGTEMTSDAQKKAVRKYDEAKTVQFKMKLNKGTDADILKKLDSVSNKQGYIKELIRADIEQSK